MAKSYIGRVRAGATWLDEHAPDWIDKIDLPTLLMEHGAHCILGQVFDDHGPNWINGYEWATDKESGLLKDDAEIRRLGFELDIEEDYPGYVWLQRRWTQYIQERRGTT